MNLSSPGALVRPIGVGVALCASLSVSARAAERLIHLDVPRDIAKGLSAYPRIAAPADAAERRINAALARLDFKVRKAAADCKSDAGTRQSSWKRVVRVPMRGPRFISFVVADDVDCGGAHPSTSTMAIVYDLTTGNPIDWTALLPPSFTGKPELREGPDGTKMIALAGKALFDAYLRRYRPRAAGAKEDVDADCRATVEGYAGGQAPPVMVWLDAKQAALVAYFDLSHAIQACGEQVAIPVSELREAGTKPLLIDAIDAAHRNQ